MPNEQQLEALCLGWRQEVGWRFAHEARTLLRAAAQVCESVRARLCILVRRCLQKWKYPPDSQADAVELVLKQAESLANTWSN